MRDFTLAIDRNPGGYELYYFRGNGFMGLKKYAEAIPDYQEAIRLNPDYDPALFNLACAYSLIGKGELALPHLERAIRLKPENREAAIKDKDFDSLRLLPAFKKLVGQ
jgi:tetratricopeptide (TPR) repeat protein